MTPSPNRYQALMAVGLSAALLTYVGCTSRTGTDSPAPFPTTAPASTDSKEGTSTSKTASDDEFPPFAGATASGSGPVASLVISGEQYGYLEPCGCTQGQLGGLKRRFDLVERLRNEQKMPLILIDLGSLVKDPAGARGGFDQAKLKFQVALKALGLLKYDALALSPDDLKVGCGEALMQFLNAGDHPAVVAANVVPAAGFEKMVRPSVRVQAGPMSVGITAVVDPEALKKLADPDREALLPTIKNPEEALTVVLADLEKNTQVQVLMVQGPPELARSLGAKFPSFDIVVASSPFDPPREAETLPGGKTLLVSVGPKGKYAASWSASFLLGRRRLRSRQDCFIDA